MSVDSTGTDRGPDQLTVYAIAVICYFLVMVAHEALGHAVTTVLLGGRVDQITSAACSCDTSGLGPWAARAVFAGGCVANIVTGLLGLWWGSRLPSDRSRSRYAAWLFGHLGCFVAAGYLMVFPFLPAGDWHDFVAGLPMPMLWKTGLTLLGIAGYAATMWHAQRGLETFLGATAGERRARARTLTLIPYLVGGTVETLSSVIGGGGILTVISAIPATFGGTIGLVFVGVGAAHARPAEDAAEIRMPRAPFVIAIGAVVVLVHLFWFGPGLLH